MTHVLPVTTSLYKTPDQATINKLIDIYIEAYKNDNSFQLKHVSTPYKERMAETIVRRCRQPDFDFILARAAESNQILGWIALAFNFDNNRKISEESVLFAQYILIPDIAAKGKNEGIDIAEMTNTAHIILIDCKEAREKALPDQHCIISALVVDPAFQNRGVASALLSKAISCTEAISYPIWVQAPPSCQSFFANHHFTGAGGFQAELFEHAFNIYNTGKARAESALGSYSWEFMVRQAPLEPALQAHRSSGVFTEHEEEQRVNKKRQRRITQLNAEAEVSKRRRGAHRSLEEDVQTARGEDPMFPDNAEAGPSTPRHFKTDTSMRQRRGWKTFRRSKLCSLTLNWKVSAVPSQAGHKR